MIFKTSKTLHYPASSQTLPLISLRHWCQACCIGPDCGQWKRWWAKAPPYSLPQSPLWTWGLLWSCLPWTPKYPVSARTVMSKALINGFHALCWTLCKSSGGLEDFYKPYMDLGFLLGVLTPMQDLESTNSNLKPRILCQKGRCAEGQPWSSR